MVTLILTRIECQSDQLVHHRHPLVEKSCATSAFERDSGSTGTR
jgi:hypothetical protein